MKILFFNIIVEFHQIVETNCSIAFHEIKLNATRFRLNIWKNNQRWLVGQRVMIESN